LNFDPEVLDVKNVRQLACGRKHFIVLTNDNNLLVWGDVLKDKSEFNSEGFHLHFGDKLFDDG
jgi:alpha-tubulin suppressor-like RCC1 family protein